MSRTLQLSKRGLSAAIVQPPAPQPWKTLHGIIPVVIPTTENFFPDIPTSSEGTPVSKAAALEVSKLSNSVTVASVEHHSHAAAAGIFVRGGSRAVPRHNAAVPAIVGAAAFKASAQRSHFLTIRKLEELGLTPTIAVNRDQISYSFESLRSNASEAFSLVAECLTPRISDADLHTFAEQVKENAKAARESGAETITDALHAAAFTGTLANPVVLSDADIDRVHADDVANFIRQNFVGSNIVVAAHGVNHADFVARANESVLGHLPTGSALDVTGSRYKGGDCVLISNSGDVDRAQIAVGFEGASWTDKDLPVFAVIQTLLGGGSSFSAGGPGKGMLSRLYREVLMKHGWVESAVSYCAAYDNTGVVGIQGSCHVEAVPQLLDLFHRVLQSITSDIGEEELTRAKNQTSFGMLVTLERRVAAIDDIARQLQSLGKYYTPSEFLKLINDVTVADVHRVAKKFLSSNLSFASVAAQPIPGPDVRTIFKQ